MIYLDHNATTRPHPDVRAAMAPYLDEEFGNPSSIHEAGRRAREAVEQARDALGRLVGAGRDELVFTSGGTEANHLGLRGLAEAARARDPRRGRVLVSAVEHPSAAGAARALVSRGFRVEWIEVARSGAVDPDDVARRLGDDVAVVAVQLANHETGRLQDLAAIVERARARGARVHSDCVQALGKVPLDLGALGVDTASLSAHKVHGPKGTGALYVRSGVAIEPQVAGGHQERERRPGTEHVAGAVGFGAAARIIAASGAAWAEGIARRRERLEAGLLAMGAEVCGDGPRVCNTSCARFAAAEGELIVESLDLAGVAASTGAACTSGSVEPSPVLLAMGYSRAEARQAVRFSLGRDNTDGEIDRVLGLLPEILDRVRRA